MKITLSHKQFPQVIHTISTPHNDPDKLVNPSLAGIDLNTLKAELSQAYGHYGHTIDLENTTNLDLQAASYKLPSFEVVSVEPAIAPNPLPDNALS